jgi:DinB superfamily
LDRTTDFAQNGVYGPGWSSEDETRAPRGPDTASIISTEAEDDVDSQAMIAAYLGGIEELRRAVAGMTPEQLVARPIPGRWSTLEVVCHLADFEPIYADRMKRVIATDRPLLLSAGREAFARSLAYHQRDIGEELALIDVTRRQIVRIMKCLYKDALDRVGIYRHEGHEEERSLGLLLEMITGHIPHHAAFIVEKRRALGIEPG